MWMILFFVLPLLGLVYVSWHVYVLLPLSAPWRWAVVIIGWLAFLCVFANFSHRIDHMPLGVASAFYETGYSSIFILLYLVPFSLARPMPSAAFCAQVMVACQRGHQPHDIGLDGDAVHLRLFPL